MDQALMRLSGKRRWLLGVIVTLGACFGYVYQWKWSRRPVRREFSTQRQGESRHVWRAMRVAWTFHPRPKGTPWTVNDLFGDETRLFYSSDCEAGCLDPNTGQVLWRYPVVSHGVAQTGPTSSQDTNHSSSAVERNHAARPQRPKTRDTAYGTHRHRQPVPGQRWGRHSRPGGAGVRVGSTSR